MLPENKLFKTSQQKSRHLTKTISKNVLNIFNGCPAVSNETDRNLAIAYDVISADDKYTPRPYLSLEQGKNIDVPGIGTGYIKNKQTLGIQDDKLYWVVGACSTNKRVLIDAENGELTGPVHNFVYCGGTE